MKKTFTTPVTGPLSLAINARTTNGDVTVIRNDHQAEISTSTTNGADRVL